MTAKTPEPSRDAGSATSSTPAQPATGSTPAVKPPPAVPPSPAPAARPTPAARPKRPSQRSADGPLVILTVLAVLVSLGATAIALYSLDQAREAISRANEATNTADRAAAGPATARPATTAPRPSAAPTPTASRGPAFVPELVRSTLRVPAADSRCASVYVDVDTMSVGAAAGHEFYLSNCVGPLSVHVDRTAGAVPTANNPTPDVCAAQLTGGTDSNELVLPVINGLTFCLLTNKSDAAQQGIPQRIAILEVTNVGADNSVNFAVSTYRVPATP